MSASGPSGPLVNRLYWLGSLQMRSQLHLVYPGVYTVQLAFLFYIKNLPENIQSQVRLYAEDTAVYFVFNL